jgi:hypothetical protein
MLDASQTRVTRDKKKTDFADPPTHDAFQSEIQNTAKWYDSAPTAQLAYKKFMGIEDHSFLNPSLNTLKRNVQREALHFDLLRVFAGSG